MPVTSYHTIGGRIRGQSSGSSRTEYLPDGLGSVVGTASSGAEQASYRHKPYGDRLSKSGSGADPRFLWAGTWGYRDYSLSHAERYVRARHYSSRTGRWTSVDPLWPMESAYGYVGGRPTTAVDPSGMQGLAHPGLRIRKPSSTSKPPAFYPFVPGFADPPNKRRVVLPKLLIPRSPGQDLGALADYPYLLGAEAAGLIGTRGLLALASAGSFLAAPAWQGLLGREGEAIPTWTNAQELFEHYVGNSGRMFRLSDAAMSSLISATITTKVDYDCLVRSAFAYADQLCEGFHTFSSPSTISISVENSQNIDWHNSVHWFDMWARAQVRVKGKYVWMKLIITFHDIYDFNNKTSIYYHLSERGLATPFETRGDLIKRGQWLHGVFKNTRPCLF